MRTVSVSVVGSCSLNSNCKLSSSASDEEMNALVSILSAIRVEPCRLSLDGILLQGETRFCGPWMQHLAHSVHSTVSFKFKHTHTHTHTHTQIRGYKIAGEKAVRLSTRTPNDCSASTTIDVKKVQIKIKNVKKRKNVTEIKKRL